MRSALRCLLLLLTFQLWTGQAWADTPIRLFKSFAGNVNFVGAERTYRKYSNSSTAVSTPYCVVSSASDVTEATISGIPAGAKILSAQLYWTASGPTASRSNPVIFDGTSVTAPTDRQYFVSPVLSQTTYNFYSGAYDVTERVSSKRNAKYTFSGLNISNGSPWCGNQTVVGGWAMIVVYSLPTETFRVLNIYEGFQWVQNGSVTLTLSNFEIPPLTSGQTGRVAHITWEGDDTLSGTSAQEYLTFNGTSLYNSYNPNGNQFNSVSTINGVDTASFGIDYDAYTVSSPIIQAGQTSATTVYASSQDLVLLSSEIIAVPNTPVSDLAISVAHDPQTLFYGQTALLTMSVTNNGPAADQGTVQVVDTLPPSLGFVYGGGDGWSCSVAGQKVTCNYTLPLDVGATTPPIQLTVMVNSTTTPITHAATVSGANFDNLAGNNTASESIPVSIPPYVLTTKACTAGTAILPAGSSTSASQCAFINWAGTANGPIVAGDSVGMFITLLNTSGLPTPPTQNSTVNLRFAMSCVNPNKGSPEFASFPSSNALLPKCAENNSVPTVWTTAQPFNVSTNSPSINTAMTFTYFDVGRIKLYITDASGKAGGSGPIVMKPFMVDMEVYKTLSSGRYNNPAAVTPSDARFVSAGEDFTISVGVRTKPKNNAIYYAQNFGQESPAKDVDLSKALPATDTSKNPAIPFTDMTKLPELLGALGNFSVGRASGTFNYGEVGIIKLTPQMSGNDYLGAGSVTTAATMNIGRFTPDHFDTSVPAASSAGPVLPCSVNVTCPTDVAGMVYSRQPFDVTIKAFDTQGNELENYQGVFARNVYLCGAKNQVLANGAGVCPAVAGNVAGPADSLLNQSRNLVLVAPSLFNDGTAILDAAIPTDDRVNYYLPNPYLATSPRTSGQTAPTQIYVRATDADGISSLYGANASRDVVEGSVMVVNGRVLVPNIFGSELQYLPVSFKTQFWNGTRWVTSDTESTVVGSTSTLAFNNCKKNLASNCTTVLGATATTNLSVVNGQGKFLMKAPGSGNSGTADYYFNVDLGWPIWLPSTLGRATFGVYRNSPVTYVRELY